MFFHGIRLVDGSELDVFVEKDFEFSPWEKLVMIHSTPAHFSAQMHNYDKLDDCLNFVTKIELTERVSESVFKHFEADSGRFLRIFDNVAVIRSEVKIERAELFHRLLTSFTQLCELTISNSGLSQDWFDRLLKHLENVKTLRLLNVEEEKPIDLSFACKFPELRGLWTNKEIFKREPTRDQWNNFIFCCPKG